MSYDEGQFKSDLFVQTQNQMKWDLQDSLNTRAANEEVLGEVLIPEYKAPAKPATEEQHIAAEGIDAMKINTQSLAETAYTNAAKQIPVGGSIQ